VPRVDLSLWPDSPRDFAARFVDVEVPFSLRYGPSGLRIEITGETECRRVYRVGRVFFAANASGQLGSIGVDGLNARELAALDESVGSA
jgi:hypothetical protein